MQQLKKIVQSTYQVFIESPMNIEHKVLYCTVGVSVKRINALNMKNKIPFFKLKFSLLSFSGV
jgi:hypothetical protein